MEKRKMIGSWIVVIDTTNNFFGDGEVAHKSYFKNIEDLEQWNPRFTVSIKKDGTKAITSREKSWQWRCRLPNRTYQRLQNICERDDGRAYVFCTHQLEVDDKLRPWMWWSPRGDIRRNPF